MSQELKLLIHEFAINSKTPISIDSEVAINRGLLKYYDRKPQKMLVEDLAAMERLTEDTILEELGHRTKKGLIYTFVGDILCAVNANDTAFDSPEVIF